MTTLIQKQRELFDKTMHKYICSCVIDNIEKCPRTETVRHFLTTCLIEHYEEDIRKLDGLKGKGASYGNCSHCWADCPNDPCTCDSNDSSWNSALSLAISLLQDKIKELKK